MIDANGKKSNMSDVKVILNTNSVSFIPNTEWLKNAKYPVVLDPSVETNPQITEEIAEKRTETSKTFLNNDNSYTSVMFQNPIHYSDGGKYKDIDRAFVSSTDPNYKYEVATGIYKAKLKGALSGANDINIEYKDGDIGFSPRNIKWSNGEELGQLSKVTGQLSSDKTKISYNSVFGISGINLEAIYDNEKFLKETVINSEQVINASSHINDNLEISFVLSLPNDVDLKVNGKIWDKNSAVTTEDEIPVIKNGDELSILRKAVVYSQDGKNREVIKVKLSKENNKLILTKIISGKFLSQSSYPVRTDATATIYSDVADGYISKQGASTAGCEACSHLPFHASAPVLSSELTTDSTSTNMTIGMSSLETEYEDPDNGDFRCDKTVTGSQAFLAFNSAGILGAGDTVTDAVLSVYPSVSFGSVTTVYARSYDWGATLEYADLRTLGDGTQLASISTSSLTTGAYRDFTSTGSFAGAVVKDGWTRLYLNSFNWPNYSNNDEGQIYSADQTGTSQDPKLAVTYTPAAATDTPTPTSTPTPTNSPTPTPTLTPTPGPQVKVQGGIRIQGGTRL